MPVVVCLLCRRLASMIIGILAFGVKQVSRADSDLLGRHLLNLRIWCPGHSRFVLPYEQGAVEHRGPKQLVLFSSDPLN